MGRRVVCREGPLSPGLSALVASPRFGHQNVRATGRHGAADDLRIPSFTTVWGTNNLTPHEVERTFVRDLDGAEVWVVVLVATFDINPDGTTTLAPEQQKACTSPIYAGDPGCSSLLREPDLVLRKTGTDVLVDGTAYAPDGKPAKEVPVSLAVGSVNKTLVVVGDRQWVDASVGTTTRPRPFTHMPVRYEHAYGGKDIEDPDRWFAGNPAGVGYAKRKSKLTGTAAPNIRALNGRIDEVAGFGALDRSWQPRLTHAGTYDAKWEQDRMPLYPTDFDEAFFQIAPADQVTKAPLRGGEAVALVNMTPNGQLTFEVPSMRPGFRTFFDSGPVEHKGTLHTLIIEPELLRVQMVWHTALPCHPKIHDLVATDVFLKVML